MQKERRTLAIQQLKYNRWYGFGVSSSKPANLPVIFDCNKTAFVSEYSMKRRSTTLSHGGNEGNLKVSFWISDLTESRVQSPESGKRFEYWRESGCVHTSSCRLDRYLPARINHRNHYIRLPASKLPKSDWKWATIIESLGHWFQSPSISQLLRSNVIGVIFDWW